MKRSMLVLLVMASAAACTRKTPDAVKPTLESHRATAIRVAEDAAKAQVAAQREQARVEREARQNPGVLEGISRQFGRTVQRQVINRVAGQLVRGILGGLFRGR